MSSMTEMEKFTELLQTRKREGNIVARDVATYAMLLINNGWLADQALAESERTLQDAEE